jgi:hypothetical protein
MALHNTLEGFMGELKALPKGSPDRGRFITAHMSHPPFLSAVQKHPEGKKIHSQLMGFLNSPANAGPAGAKVTVKAELSKADAQNGQWGHASNQPVNETTSEGLEAPYKGDWADTIGTGNLASKYFVHNDRHLNQVQASKSPDGKISVQYIPHTDDTYAADEQEFAENFPGKTYIPYEAPTKLGSVNNFNEARQVGDALIQHLKAGGHQSEFQHPLLQAQSMPGRLGSSVDAVGKPQMPQKLMNSEAPATILKSEGDNSVADKEYTVEEAAAILRKNFHEKLVKYSAEIEKLVGREKLSKSVIPSHKHNQAAAASSGTEDIAAGQANPKGDFKAEKAEKCMKCGDMHKPLEKCGEITKGEEKEKLGPCDACGENKAPKDEVLCPSCKKLGDKAPAIAFGKPAQKSDLVDSKGKRSDNHTDPQSADMPDKSPAEPEKRADSSGGKLTKKGPKDLAKAARSMSKAQIKDSSGKVHNFDDAKIKKIPKTDAPSSESNWNQKEGLSGVRYHHTGPVGKRPNMDQSNMMDKAQPPMAKPPSGGAPGGSKTPPMSKPAAPPKMGGAPAMKAEPVEKAGLGMAASGQREAAAMGHPAAGGAPAPAAAKPVKLPGAPAQAARSAGFQDQIADVAAANKPAAAAKPALPKPAASGPAGAKLGLASPKAAGATNAGPVQNAARPVAAKPGIFGKLFGKKQA